jgi:hypothetical protein
METRFSPTAPPNFPHRPELVIASSLLPGTVQPRSLGRRALAESVDL